QCFDFVRGGDDAETVAQPLHDRTRDKDASFERILSPFAYAPGDCGEEIIARDDRLRAGVHEHEATGAVSVFDHAGLIADLTKESGLLVACNTGNRNGAAEHIGLA